MTPETQQSVRELLVALEDWRQAIETFKRGGQRLPDKEQQVKTSGRRVVALLEDEAVAIAIQSLIQTARTQLSEVLDDFHAELLRQPEPILTKELESLGPLQCSRTDMDSLVQAYCDGPKHPQNLPRADQLQTYFVSLQSAMLEDLEQSRHLSRPQKKRRKRRVAMGVLFTACGLGLLAGNTLMDWQYAATSYILGGNALMQAVQDLVGDDADA